MKRLSAVVFTAVAFGCGSTPSTRSGPAPREAPSVVPAGVDTLVAEAADSLADVSFVEVSAQDEALTLQQEGRLMVERTDSLWMAMSAAIDSAQVVSEEDSLAARTAADEGGLALVELDSLLRTSDLDVDALAAYTAALLDSAEIALEAAFQLNPFDTRSRMWLAQVYGLQARRLGRTEAYGRAIDELEKLALLTPDQHSVYAMLANNYFYVSNWDGATLNYQRAEEVYLATFDLGVDDPQPLDSTVVFSYVQAQADMHVKRLDARRAADMYDRAYAFAGTAEDSAYIAGELEWMAWDGMNITSSFARDSLLALEQAGDLATARRGYLDLLPGLSVQAAIDEIDWRLAIVDYNLDNAEPAAERLRELVARTPTDSLGVPVDAAYVQYFNDYGTLCLNLGRSYRLDRRDSRTALKYFTQATQVAWTGKAVAYFEVARLVQGNLTAALENAAFAMEGEQALPGDQRLDLYRLMIDLHRRAGNFDEAREFRDAYRALQGR